MKQLQRWAIALGLTIATVLTVVIWQPQAPAQSAKLTLDDAGLRMAKISDHVYSLIASTDFPPKDENAAICNGGIVIGSEGVLVVDPFQTEALANLLFETVKTLTDQPIRYVVNSHYHFDHTGGNAAVTEQKYPLLGRGPIREYMLSRNMESDPNATPPNVILHHNGEIWLGDRKVEITEFDGHSGGTDLVLYVPDENVLIAGDLLFTQRLPYLGDANIRVWQETLEELTNDYATATILPGHGPVSDRGDLETLQGYLDDLENWALAWKQEELSQEDAIAQTQLPDQYSDYLFQGLFTSNLEVAYQQITLGKDDQTSIQEYFKAQAPELQAL